MLRKLILKICIYSKLPLKIRARLYRFAKALQVIKVPVGKGSIPEPSEEDRLLAEAGLEDFVTRLAKEEE